jgi:addiction module RelE/StbE family toxin
MTYEIRFTKEAVKDVKKLTPRLRKKLQTTATGQLHENPYAGKRLVGDLEGFYSLRLTHKDRVVYTIDEALKVVFVHRARTHYGK